MVRQIKHQSLSTSQKVAIRELTLLKNSYQPTKTLLVTGKQSFISSGAKILIDQCFEAREYIHFNSFELNPKIEDALNGAQLALDNHIDLIIAIGGGSPMDIAKLIKALLSTHTLSNTPKPTISTTQAHKIIRGESQISDCDIPLIAIPTTAGSGSEATHFAVAYIDKQKFSVSSPILLPSANILSGSLLLSASPYQKAINGLDALAQAIEGYWAINNCKESAEYSLTAITLLTEHLPKIIHGSDHNDLNAVMQAAHFAGKAINLTKTTAPHAFSYGFTSYYDVPHGHAVWLTLPKIFKLHCNCSQQQLGDKQEYTEFSQRMGTLCKALKIHRDGNEEKPLEAFMCKLGIEPSMKEMGANSKEQRLFISEQVNTQRLGNNPIKLTLSDIKYIFEL